MTNHFLDPARISQCNKCGQDGSSSFIFCERWGFPIRKSPPHWALRALRYVHTARRRIYGVASQVKAQGGRAVADFPALPLWTDAYLADTTHLSHAEHGRYLLMLIHLWRTPYKKFPNDDAWLARKFGCCEEDIHELYRPLISEFFKSSGNWLYQKRILKEFERVQAVSKRASDRRKSRNLKDNGGNSACSTASVQQEDDEVVSSEKSQPSGQNRKSRSLKNAFNVSRSSDHTKDRGIHNALKTKGNGINSSCSTASVQQPEPYHLKKESKLSLGDTDSLAENGKNNGGAQPRSQDSDFSVSEAEASTELTAQANGSGTVELSVSELLGSLGRPGPLRSDDEPSIQSDWQSALVRYGLPETPRKPSWQRNGDGTFVRVRQ